MRKSQIIQLRFLVRNDWSIGENKTIFYEMNTHECAIIMYLYNAKMDWRYAIKKYFGVNCIIKIAVVNLSDCKTIHMYIDLFGMYHIAHLYKQVIKK